MKAVVLEGRKGPRNQCQHPLDCREKAEEFRKHLLPVLFLASVPNVDCVDL